MKNAFAFVALVSCATATSHAATPPLVPASLLACAKLQDANERVRCYDAQIAAMKAASAPSKPVAAAPAPAAPAAPVRAGSSAPPPAAPAAPVSAGPSAPVPTAPGAPAPAAPSALHEAPASAAATPGQSTEAKFGEELLPPAHRPKPNPKEATLVSSITAVQRIPGDVFLISLANGQVWREHGTQVALFLRAGDAVHIERHTLGSYHLWAPALGAKNWVYVSRVR